MVPDEPQCRAELLEILAPLVDCASAVELVLLEQLGCLGRRLDDGLAKAGLEVDVGRDPEWAGVIGAS